MASVKLIGFDIGGTKCASIVGTANTENGDISIDYRVQIETPKGTDPYKVFDMLCDSVKDYLDGAVAIGISCGGPLNSKTGVILSPPNLVGWDNIKAVDYVSEKTGIPTAIQNDANACALAEWKFGAGRGYSNLVFYTFGTGFGAGLILDGRLYAGTNDNAGEIGHVRLSEYGPVGYGKSGSVEGFCSGSGIAKIGQNLALEKLQMGKTVDFCPDGDISKITAKTLAIAAENGDETAIKAYEISARMLGRTCSMTIDILNPEVIVIGSVFQRSEKLFRKIMEKTVNEEALSLSASVCKIVPAELGDKIGDYAALAVALNRYTQINK
ncbi:MAG: ROK family protein [Clostridia bacterium]|nr:ROK family protein [Clostridia bacterium]